MQKKLPDNFNKLKIKKLFLIGIILLAIAGCNHSPKNINNNTADPGNTNLSKEIIKTPSDSSANSKTVTRQELDKLIGKWKRTDGSYTIEIFSVKTDGNLDAGYLNPNPIRVEKGQWIFKEANLFIRVILRDVNYPGSTYTLEYNKSEDYLFGNYFQAVEGMNYDVVFTRNK